MAADCRVGGCPGLYGPLRVVGRSHLPGGHTHAGQLWPATYVAKMIFEYNKGLHDFNGTNVYVSQGTGTFGPPMRVGTESELAILNLNPGE